MPPVLVLWVYLKDWWRTIRTYFLEKDSFVCDFACTCAVAFKPILSFGKHSVVSVFVAVFPYIRLGLPMETLLDPYW